MRYLGGGESHGPCLTGIVEGLPAGLKIEAGEIDRHLRRRQQGYGRGARMRIESDEVIILSGLRFSRTMGSPLTLQVLNRDWENWKEAMAPGGDSPRGLKMLTRPRPGHADLAGGLKYDCDDLRPILERSSARETAMRVAVGTVGRLLLEHFGVRLYSHVLRIGGAASPVDPATLPDRWEAVEESPVRCADHEAGAKMVEEIRQATAGGDTLGGVVEVYVTGLPPGLGSHVQADRKLDGRLAGGLMSIQAVKGVEIGAGFSAASTRGSELHDPLVSAGSAGITRPSNRAGGIEGGISNGLPVVVRVALKPIPTLRSPLPSVDWVTGTDSPGAVERSDVCAVPAAAVVTEAVTAWELAVAFREKFAGDSMGEVEAAYTYYMKRVDARLHRPGP